MKRPQTLRALDALKYVIETLRGFGIPEANCPQEARAILKDGLEIDTLRMYRDNPPLSPGQLRRLGEILDRRKKREPLQYILGFVWFYGLKILVGEGALIPRPETEILVEETLRRAGKVRLEEKGRRIKILDLCTGSGAIALALAKNLPRADILATDISAGALGWAEKNRRACGAENVRFLEGDLFGPAGEGKSVFDFITANPPYIKEEKLKSLEPEVVCWEPRIALSGGRDGLDLTGRIIREAPAHLERGGFLLVETAGGTGPDVFDRMAGEAGLRMEALVRDLAGFERVFIAKKA